MDNMSPEERDAPIYSTFGELFNKGFSLDTTWVSSWAYTSLRWYWAFGLSSRRLGLGGGCLGAGASRHWLPFNDRLFPATHNPQRNEKVSLPVHLFFCVFGQC